MTQDRDNTLKEREIHLARGDSRLAGDAATLLADADGIVEARALEGAVIKVRYDLRRIGLEIMEDALAELGFPLDASLGAKMRRALIYYTEETQRANLGIEYDLPYVTREAFVRSWRQRPHGCRDHRPPHWRRYW